MIDANLYHDKLTGRAVTGALHLINQMACSWFTKKQGKPESATHGSEFMAARIATEQALADRACIRYLGVPIRGKTRMFGDNESVVNSSSLPYAKLHKRHTAISFHAVRAAIAAKVIGFCWLPSKLNAADLLSKHWSYYQVRDSLRAMMFWSGDTGKLLSEDHHKSYDSMGGDKDSIIMTPKCAVAASCRLESSYVDSTIYG